MSGISGDAFVERAQAIQSKADFTAFLPVLLQNYQSHPEEWENDNLELFLQGLAGFIENIEGYYKNVGLNVDLQNPSWRVFADALLAARVYE